MNRYRAYMNRIHAPSGLRHRVLESAERGQRPAALPADGSGPGPWPPASPWPSSADGRRGSTPHIISPIPPPGWPTRPL